MSATRPYNGFRALRPEYLKACDGNACAALLLDLFAYWTQVRSSNNDQAVSGGKEGNDLWFFRSLTDLHDDLYGAFGRAAIRTGLQVLTERKLIESRSNPLRPWDRTLQYRTLHCPKPNDAQGSESDDDAGARPSPPSEARVDREGREKQQETARDARVDLAPKPPRPKPRASFKGKPVPDHLTDRAVSVLAAYNASFGQSLRPFSGTGKPSGHLTQVLGKVVEHEDMELADFERVLGAVKANPPSFCDGRAVGLGDIFGPKAWTRALENGGQPAQNGHVLQPRTVAEAKWLEKREHEKRGNNALEKWMAERDAAGRRSEHDIEGEATEL